MNGSGMSGENNCSMAYYLLIQLGNNGICTEQLRIFWTPGRRYMMEKQSLAQFETMPPHEAQQMEPIHVAEPVRHGNQSDVTSVIIMRWLSIFFCLAFWYGLYRLVV